MGPYLTPPLTLYIQYMLEFLLMKLVSKFAKYSKMEHDSFIY